MELCHPRLHLQNDDGVINIEKRPLSFKSVLSFKDTKRGLLLYLLLYQGLGERVSDLGLGRVRHLSARDICTLGARILAELLHDRRASVLWHLEGGYSIRERVSDKVL